MKIMATSGGAGDIVYSIPVARLLGITHYAVKVNYYHTPHENLCKSIQRLLNSQGFEVIPTSGAYPVGEYDPALKYYYKTEDFLQQPSLGRNHIILSMANQWQVPMPDVSAGWLHGIKPKDNAPAYLVHVTPRWRERSRVRWANVIRRIPTKPVFIGHMEEHKRFCEEIGQIIPYLFTRDLYSAAQYIAGCKALYCNQSVMLTIAQGLNKRRYLERKPMKTNVILPSKLETYL